VVVVELDDEPGVRLAGSMPGDADLEIGMAMQVRFDPLEGGGALPQWQPVRAQEETWVS
jgi:hypothetical protein